MEEGVMLSKKEGLKQFRLAISLPLKINITKDHKWFIAKCPFFGLVAQGKTNLEARGNIVDLIKDFLADPDTQKPSFEGVINIQTFSKVRIPKSNGVPKMNGVSIAKT
jgi:predicted RNase H-like HicB family nuclease